MKLIFCYRKTNDDSPIAQGRGIPKTVDPYMKMRDLIHQHNEYERLTAEPEPMGQTDAQKEARAQLLKRYVVVYS